MNVHQPSFKSFRDFTSGALRQFLNIRLAVILELGKKIGQFLRELLTLFLGKRLVLDLGSRLAVDGIRSGCKNFDLLSNLLSNFLVVLRSNSLNSTGSLLNGSLDVGNFVADCVPVCEIKTEIMCKKLFI